MKRLVFLLLLLPVFSPAQSSLFDFDTLPPGSQRLDLPLMKSQHGYRGSKFIVTNDSVYKALFPDSVQSQLPKIDFKRYELVATAYCAQCLAVCHSHPQCHRNACHYTRDWHTRDKTNRVKLAAVMLNGTKCYFFSSNMDQLICRDDSSFSELQKSCPALAKDSVDFNRQIVLVQELYLDCAAHVEQEFYLDTAAHCLVWRLHTGYGGCHGMKQHTFIAAVPKPPAGYAVRVEKYSIPFED